MLELLDDCEHLEETAWIIVTLADITTFQKQSTKPFITHLKEYLSSHFSSLSDVISAMSIFDPRKTPKADPPDLSRYGEKAITTILVHYGSEKPAETLHGNKQGGHHHH